ncbi:MAG: hypothetical protein AAGJ79_10920, partial [Verrucomicrobiota bacterium]
MCNSTILALARGTRNSGWLAALCVTLLLTSAHSETQTFNLAAGWNAIWLEIDPADREPATVFDGIPVEQVWCYFPTTSPVEYINDPEAGLFNVDGWNVYLPENDSR